MKTTTKNEVRELVAAVRQTLAPAGRKRASRAATARALKVAVGSVYNWEKGLTVPRAAAVEDLRRILQRATPAPKKRAVRADQAADADRLSRMLGAIAACGGVEGARTTFERAAASLS